jgi:hypothetical protein
MRTVGLPSARLHGLRWDDRRHFAPDLQLRGGVDATLLVAPSRAPWSGDIDHIKQENDMSIGYANISNLTGGDAVYISCRTRR